MPSHHSIRPRTFARRVPAISVPGRPGDGERHRGGAALPSPQGPSFLGDMSIECDNGAVAPCRAPSPCRRPGRGP